MELYLDPLKGTTPTAPAAHKVTQMTVSGSNKTGANQQHQAGEVFLVMEIRRHQFYRKSRTSQVGSQGKKLVRQTGLFVQPLSGLARGKGN